MDFSAVLLAGGKSSRMGRDKATLVIDFLPLWRRQIGVLRETGAAEVFVSGEPGTFGEIETRKDDVPDQGPLTGLLVSLRRARFPLLLVRAGDLPVMTPRDRQKLAVLARPGVGVIPRRGEFYEPLAAVFPREALVVAEQCRTESELARKLVVSGFLLPLDVSGDGLFANINTPEEWAHHVSPWSRQKSC